MAMSEEQLGRFVDQCITDAVRRGDVDVRIRRVVEQMAAGRRPTAAAKDVISEVDRRARLDYWDTRRRLDDLLPGWDTRSLAEAVEQLVRELLTLRPAAPAHREPPSTARTSR